jgi:hypothetical protein
MIKTGTVELIPTPLAVRWAGSVLSNNTEHSSRSPSHLVTESAVMAMLCRMTKRRWPPAPALHTAITNSGGVRDLAEYFFEYHVY